MEYTTAAGHSADMKKPSEDSVQEMLDLVQRQQVQKGEFRGRVFNPLPAIGKKRGASHGGALAGLSGDNDNKAANSGSTAVPPRLERESTIFDLRQSRSNNMATTMSADGLDFKGMKSDQNILKCKSKGKPAPRVPYALRRESTNYHLPPLSDFQIQDPHDIERPSAPSPESKELIYMTHEEELNIDWGSNNNEERPLSPELFDRNTTYQDSYTGYLQDSNNGGQLSPWPATEAPNNGEWGALPEQETEQPYERPKTARGRRRGERELIQRSTPRGSSSQSSSTADTGTMIERPKTARGSRRFADRDSIDARPRTRGRRRETSEQDAYEPYERPKTAKGGKREQQGESERPRTARGRRRSEDDPPDRQRPSRKARPKSPGPHHHRYRMMNTNSRSSNNEFDENRIIENVAVMNSAT